MEENKLELLGYDEVRGDKELTFARLNMMSIAHCGQANLQDVQKWKIAVEFLKSLLVIERSKSFVEYKNAEEVINKIPFDDYFLAYKTALEQENGIKGREISDFSYYTKLFEELIKLLKAKDPIKVQLEM